MCVCVCVWSLFSPQGQGKLRFPCPADHKLDWWPYPVDVSSLKVMNRGNEKNRWREDWTETRIGIFTFWRAHKSTVRQLSYLVHESASCIFLYGATFKRVSAAYTRIRLLGRTCALRKQLKPPLTWWSRMLNGWTLLMLRWCVYMFG